MRVSRQNRHTARRLKNPRTKKKRVSVHAVAGVSKAFSKAFSQSLSANGVTHSNGSDWRRGLAHPDAGSLEVSRKLASSHFFPLPPSPLPPLNLFIKRAGTRTVATGTVAPQSRWHPCPHTWHLGGGVLDGYPAVLCGHRLSPQRPHQWLRGRVPYQR